MVRLVIFDNNGTLEDDIDLAYGSVVKIFSSYNLKPPTLEQYRQEISAQFMNFYYKYGFQRNFSGHGEDGDATVLNAIRKEYYRKHSDMSHFRYDALKTILELGSLKIRVAIVSAEIESVLVPKLDRVGMTALFGLDNIRADVYGDKAPVLLDVCNKMELRPAEAIYVDDTVDGTGAAQRAGLIPVGFGKGYNSPERLKMITPLIITELSELIPLIASIDF